VVGGVARLARAFAAVLLALAAPQAAAQQGVVLRLNPAAVEAWGVVRQGIARYAVAVRLTDVCAAELGEFTAQHVGQRLELRLTRSLVLVANISARVDSGRIQFPSVATTARALAQLAELESAVAAAQPGRCFLPPGLPTDTERAAARGGRREPA